MKQNVYSLYDQAAKAFTIPFFMHNDAMAIRALQATVNDPQSNVNKNPEDFALFKLAEYDDIQGRIDSLESPEKIALAIQHKDRDPESKMQETLNLILEKVSKL